MPTPVSYWPCDEGSGTTAADIIGSRNATLGGAVTWTPGGTGFGQALSGDGSATAHADFNDTGLPAGGAPRSVCLRLKTTYTDATSLYFFSYGTLAASQFFGLYVGSGKPGFTQAGAGVDAVGTIADGNWHHLAMTYDGTTTRLYIDGVADGVGTPGINTLLGAGIILGAVGGTPTSIPGAIDEIKIYDVALTAGEVMTDFTGSSGMLMPVALYHYFDQ